MHRAGGQAMSGVYLCPAGHSRSAGVSVVARVTDSESIRLLLLLLLRCRHVGLHISRVTQIRLPTVQLFTPFRLHQPPQQENTVATVRSAEVYMHCALIV